MQRIGEGLQYTVYTLGNGRVFKKPASVLESCYRVLVWRYPYLEMPIWKIPHDVLRLKANTRASLIGLRPLLPSLSIELGNPIVNDDCSFEQDFAIVMADYFQTHAPADNRRVIDHYIALLFRFWEYGITDRSFKLSMNFGVTHGRVILLDLGELYFEKEIAHERIHARIWERAPVHDAALNEYYFEAMNTAMTAENLEMHWGKSLGDLKVSSDLAIVTRSGGMKTQLWRAGRTPAE